MLLPLTSSSISGTGTINLQGNTFGGALVTTDGANAISIVIREQGPSGKQIFNISTISAGPMTMPIDVQSKILYYSISGTGATAMLYEWID